MNKFIGKRVAVYRNLHKNTFSIKCGNRVIGYADSIFLWDVKYTVHKSGVKRYKNTGRKNVHAFVVGTVCDIPDNKPSREIKYSPAIRDYFFDPETGQRMESSKFAFLKDGKVFIL